MAGARRDEQYMRGKRRDLHEEDAYPVQQPGGQYAVGPGMDAASMQALTEMEDAVGGPASNTRGLPPQWWNPNGPGGPRPKSAPGTMAGTPMLNVPETAMPGGSSGGLSQRAMNALNYLEQRTGQKLKDTSPQSLMGLIEAVQSNPQMGSDSDMEALEILTSESGAGNEMMKEEGGEPMAGQMAPQQKGMPRR